MLPSIRMEIDRELARARGLHPRWPEDMIHAACIVGEEAGELLRAVLRLRYEGGNIEEVREEAIQTAATCVRLLENLPEEEEDDAEIPAVPRT